MFFSEAEAKSVRGVERGERVHKDECAYCHDTPETPGGGLLVCLTDHIGFSCGEHADLHWEKTNHTMYLRIVRTKKLKHQEGDEEPAAKKPTVLGIGVAGGFANESQKYDIEEKYSIVRLPTARELALRVVVNDTDSSVTPESPEESELLLPEAIASAVLSVIKGEDVSHHAQVEEFTATETGPLVISKHALSLVQLPPKPETLTEQGIGKWHCEFPGCPFKENLWMNLTDGCVMCGRANFIGLGNEHALGHYRETRYPLAVKLGTLTDTEAEVYSYDEDDIVLDPILHEHLMHFGIDRRLIHEKTDKTLSELAVDVNNRFEFEKITEAGKKLVPAFGPGRTGMKNLGNSCYLNATVQSLFSLPPFIERYSSPGIAAGLFRDGPPDPTGSLRIQLCKIGIGLASGRYSIAPPQEEGGKKEQEQVNRNGISPRALKTLLGRTNPVFATNHQQDAQEFLQFLFSEMDKCERSAGFNAEQCTSAQFRMQIEERLQCGTSGHVRYSWRSDNILSLSIPLDKAINLAEVTADQFARSLVQDQKALLKDGKQPIRPVVPYEACLDSWLSDESIEGWISPATGTATTAHKTSRLATFPPFLIVQLRRYVAGTAADNWQPKKLDALVSMPDILDLDKFRSIGGIQENETPLEESSQKTAPSTGSKPSTGNSGTGGIEADAIIVASLESLGFPQHKATKAAIVTGNKGIEAAAEWLLAHLEDTDAQMESALPSAAATTKLPPPPPPPSQGAPPEVETLCAMGFSEKHVRRALTETKNDVSRAADWLLSRAEELATEMEIEAASSGSNSQKPVGKPVALFPKNVGSSSKYELVAIVSHIGRTTQSGHYVAHIKKDGKWLLFNDESVTFTDEPPRDLGFLHFYRHI